MDANLVKAVADGGLGFAALVALIVVIFFQRKDMKEFHKDMKGQSEKTVEVLDKLANSVEANTKMTEKVLNLK